MLLSQALEDGVVKDLLSKVLEQLEPMLLQLIEAEIKKCLKINH